MIHDISRPLSAATPVWPGSAPFALTWLKSHRLHGYSESALCLNAHTGTHLDFPYHFLESGTRGGDLALDRVVGSCFVLDCGAAETIDRALLERAELPQHVSRLLFKTRNSLLKDGPFTERYVSLAPDAAQWLVHRGVRLVGIDYLSVEAYGGDSGTHKILLHNGVLVLEGLLLDGIPQGGYFLVALPISVPEAEGAPVRAILLEGELT